MTIHDHNHFPLGPVRFHHSTRLADLLELENAEWLRLVSARGDIIGERGCPGREFLDDDGTHGALRNPKPGIMQVTISIRLSKTLHAFVHTPRVGMLGRNVPTGQ